MKRLCILAGIIIFFLFLSSCKTAEEYSPETPYESRSVGIHSINGSGSYDPEKNESTINFRITLKSRIPTAENIIINWRIKLFVGDEFFIEINQDNYKTLFGDNASVVVDHPFDPLSHSLTTLGHVRVYADDSQGKPIPGDFYKGKEPDTLEAIITIKAFTGYIYEVSRKGKVFRFNWDGYFGD